MILNIATVIVQKFVFFLSTAINVGSDFKNCIFNALKKVQTIC